MVNGRKPHTRVYSNQDDTSAKEGYATGADFNHLFAAGLSNNDDDMVVIGRAKP